MLQAAGCARAGLGEVPKGSADVAGRKVAGVAFAVEEDQATRPVSVALAGAILAEACPGDLADEVEQPWRLRRRRDG